MTNQHQDANADLAAAIAATSLSPTEVKLCPGLKGRRGCGKPRAPGQAYCKEDTRTYHQERYQKARLTGAKSYKPRAGTIRRAKECCSACGSFDPETLGTLDMQPGELYTVTTGLICETCYFVYETLCNVGGERVLNLIRWVVANKEVLGLEMAERKRAIAEEIVYTKWFAAAVEHYKYVYGDAYDPDVHQILPSHYIYREGDVVEAMKALHPEDVLAAKSRRFAWKRLQHPNPLPPAAAGAEI